MKVVKRNGHKLELESDEINMLVGLLGHLSASAATTDLGWFMEDLYQELEVKSDPEAVNKYEQEFREKAYGSDDPSDFVILIKGADGEYK